MTRQLSTRLPSSLVPKNTLIQQTFKECSMGDMYLIENKADIQRPRIIPLLFPGCRAKSQGNRGEQGKTLYSGNLMR